MRFPFDLGSASLSELEEEESEVELSFRLRWVLDLGLFLGFSSSSLELDESEVPDPLEWSSFLEDLFLRKACCLRIASIIFKASSLFFCLGCSSESFMAAEDVDLLRGSLSEDDEDEDEEEEEDEDEDPRRPLRNFSVFVISH
jgi:hypothetical protein